MTSDRTKFINLGPLFRLEDCLQGHPLVCRDRRVISETAEHHCLYQMITGRLTKPKEESSCRFVPVVDPQPHVSPINDELWAVSVTTPTPVLISCLNPANLHTPSIAKPDLLATDDHLLYLPRHCSANIDGRAIQLRVQLQTEMPQQPLADPFPVPTEQLIAVHGSSILDAQLAKEFFTTFKAATQLQQELWHPDSAQRKVKAAIRTLAHDTKELQDMPVTGMPHPFHLVNYGLWLVALLVGITAWIVYRCRRPRLRPSIPVFYSQVPNRTPALTLPTAMRPADYIV
jgi:hypothetical protein